MGKGGGCVPSKQKTSSRKRSSDASIDVKDNAPVPMQDSATQGSPPLQSSNLEPSLPPNLKILIIFYSMYGHVELLARRMKKGVDGIEGVEGILYRVPETLTPEVLEQMKAPEKDTSIPVASAVELEEADGILFGFPTRYGSMAAQMKAFFDSTGQLWREQRLAGKPAGFFVSTGTQGGGQETSA